MWFSILLQRTFYKQRMFGSAHSRTMPLSARVYINDNLDAEAFINSCFFDKGHCAKSWIKWANRAGVYE
tara:strand:+ start:1489 stop:1695 length:207 start_codon:yes stop_codon:yes gene_type:complete